MTLTQTYKHYMYCPVTGLGLYGGFRGNRWLRNRVTIFKQFVVPSLLAQSNKDFTLWMGFRPEERNNPHVIELKEWLDKQPLKNIFTYGGLCFWDDKYPDNVAKERLSMNLHLTIRDMFDDIGDVDYIYMSVQPSDDCYRYDAVDMMHQALASDTMQAFGFTKGYIMNYQTKEVSEYNPTTNPPFYTIKFPKDIFVDPQKHVSYAPIKSHEYVANHLKYGVIDERGFLVGVHGENVSTFYNHPFKGKLVDNVLDKFGIRDTEPLKLPISIRKKIMRWLPYKVQRKLRYWFGELVYQRIYNWLRE
jgi:hypothetical protein